MCTLTCVLASRRSAVAACSDLGGLGVLAEGLDGDARDRPRLGVRRHVVRPSPAGTRSRPVLAVLGVSGICLLAHCTTSVIVAPLTLDLFVAARFGTRRLALAVLVRSRPSALRIGRRPWCAARADRRDWRPGREIVLLRAAEIGVVQVALVFAPGWSASVRTRDPLRRSAGRRSGSARRRSRPPW